MKPNRIAKFSFFLSFCLLAILCISPSQAKQSSEQRMRDLEKTLAELQDEIEQLKIDSKQAKTLNEETKTAGVKTTNEYTPRVYGTVLATYLVSTYNGDNRFSVRNTRLGVRGNTSPRISYVVQVDLHNEGRIIMLDANAMYSSGRFDTSLGQQRISISEDFLRGPSTRFAPTVNYTRSWGLSYFAKVDGEYVIGSLGNRDIGVYSRYVLNEESNLRISGGIFNGSGINQTSWDNSLNYTGRISIGELKSGWFAGASYYGGYSPLRQNLSLYTGELKYENERLFIEGVAMYRNLELNESERNQMFTGYLTTFYRIPTLRSKIFDDVAPLLRFDTGINAPIISESKTSCEIADVYRISSYAHCQFKGAKVRSRLSVGYEKIFSEVAPMSISHDDLLHDKFVVAITTVF